MMANTMRAYARSCEKHTKFVCFPATPLNCLSAPRPTMQDAFPRDMPSQRTSSNAAFTRFSTKFVNVAYLPFHCLKKHFSRFIWHWAQVKQFLTEAFAEAEKHPEDFMQIMRQIHREIL